MFVKMRDIDEPELEITPFMNLMIVLVPVLLMTMVFSHITILQLNLPDLTGSVTQSAEKNRQLEVKKKDKDKSDVLLLSEADVNYQSLVTAMDTVRGFTTVVATSAVEVELFPEISLGDAPPKRGKS
jgi:biopolymer transport protein ExbD